MEQGFAAEYNRRWRWPDEHYALSSDPERHPIAARNGQSRGADANDAERVAAALCGLRHLGLEHESREDGHWAQRPQCHNGVPEELPVRIAPDGRVECACGCDPFEIAETLLAATEAKLGLRPKVVTRSSPQSTSRVPVRSSASRAEFSSPKAAM